MTGRFGHRERLARDRQGACWLECEGDRSRRRTAGLSIDCQGSKGGDMNDDDFSRFHEERLVSGQRTLADAMRRLLKQSAPEIFGVVSDLDDAFFLEPAL